MTVQQYVQANFTTVEQEVFDYILSSFPESILSQEGTDSEEVLLLLSALAKVVGNSKEIILNLKTGHSLNEIIQKVEDDYLAENNKKLLLPLAADLKYHRLFEDLETDDLLAQLVSEKFFLQDYYQLYKNRGTLTAVSQIVKKFAAFLSEEEITYTIYELKNQVNIVIEGLDPNEYADFGDGTYSFNVDGETIDTAFLRKDLIIYDMLMSIKPLGANYNILFEFFAFNLVNILSDRVVDDGLFDPSIKLSDASLTATNPQVVQLMTDEETNDYTGTIKNPSTVSSLKLHYADWNTSAIFTENTRFEDVQESWDELSTAVDYTSVPSIRKNYIFATKDQLVAYLQVRIPSVGTKAIVTGYEWRSATENEYNIANRKFSTSDNVTNISDWLTPDIYDAQNFTVPDYNLWRGAGSVVLKYTRTLNNILEKVSYFRLYQILPEGYPDPIDDERFGYFEYRRVDDFSFHTKIIPPNTSVGIAQTSTDPNYDYLNSYLGFYFTRPDDTDVKSNTLSISLASLQGTDKTLAPVSVTATASASVSASPDLVVEDITVSATPSVSTEIDSFNLQAKLNGVAFGDVVIDGVTYTLNNSSFQDTADAISERTIVLEAPASIFYSSTTYNFVQWYDITNDLEISTNATASFTFDANTQIEARYIPGGGFA